MRDGAISAESNVRSGFASLETVRDMARLRCPNEFFANRPA